MNKEISTRELQFNIDNNVISGEPIVFNSLSEVLWDSDNKRSFREIIAPEALSQTFIDTQDVMLNVGHDREKILARRKCGRGSMDIQYSDECVRFSTECPDTQLGRDTYNMIKRGEYMAMSFAYIDGQERGDITWDFKTPDGIPTRTVHRIERLLDIAIVYNPAFSQTSVTARSIEDMENEIKAELEEVKPIEEVVNEEPKEEPAPEVKEEPKDEVSEKNKEDIKETEERAQDDTYLSALKPYEDILAAL